jgi:hypothetical protein
MKKRKKVFERKKEKGNYNFISVNDSFSFIYIIRFEGFQINFAPCQNKTLLFPGISLQMLAKNLNN